MNLEDVKPKHIDKFRFDSFDDCINRLMEEGNVKDIDSARAICATLYYEDTGHFPSEDHSTKSFNCPLCGSEGGGKEMENTKKSKSAGVDDNAYAIRGTILKQYNDQQIVEGAVLIPDEPDHDGDVISKEKIEKVAHEWMLKYRNIDLQHSLNSVALPIESYILREDKTVKSVEGDEMLLPEGTWMMSVKVEGKDTWDAVKRGELNGFSIMGVPKQEVNTVLKGKGDTIALKRTTLRDIEDAGKDWIVPAVSIVDDPAVPKARFIALKQKQKEEESGFMDKVRSVLSSVGKEKTDKSMKLSINGHQFAIKEGRTFNRENRHKLEAILVTLADMLEDYDIELIDREEGREKRIKPKDVMDYVDEREDPFRMALFSEEDEEIKQIIAKRASSLNDFVSEEEVLELLEKDYKGGIAMEKEEFLDILKEFRQDVLSTVDEKLESQLGKEKDEDEEEEELEKAEEKEEKEEEEEMEDAEKEEEDNDDEEDEEDVEKSEEDEEDEEDIEELKETLKSLKEENSDLKDTLTTIKNRFAGTKKTNQPAGNEADEEDGEESVAKSRYEKRDAFGRRKRD